MMSVFGTGDAHAALTHLVCRLWLRRLDMYTRCWANDVYKKDRALATANTVSQITKQGRAEEYRKRAEKKEAERLAMEEFLRKVQPIITGV